MKTPLTRTPNKLLAAFALAALCGCGTDPADVPLAGTWRGSHTTEGIVTFQFTWELRECDGVIAGSGSFAFSSTTVTGDVTGSYTHPDVRMTLAIGEDLRFRYVGTRTSDDVLDGTLEDPDGDGSPIPLTLTREVE